MRRKHRLPPAVLACLPVVTFLGVFFVVPLALNGFTSLRGADGSFSLVSYARLLSDSYYLGVTANTLWVSAMVTLAALVIGYPVAYVLANYSGRLAPLMIFLLIAPLLTSTIMRTFGWQVLFARRGMLNVLLRDWGIIDRPLVILQQPLSVYIGLVHVLVPFMVLSIAAVLRNIDPKLKESARLLGASRLRTFFSVTLPLSLDGVATGCILTFMVANGSFVTMLLLGDGKVVTLPVLIFQQFILTRDMHFASAMGNVLLVVAVVCLSLQLRLVRRRGVVR
jgi:putative spermidine/putrescine transport system permease protein